MSKVHFGQRNCVIPGSAFYDNRLRSSDIVVLGHICMAFEEDLIKRTDGIIGLSTKDITRQVPLNRETALGSLDRLFKAGYVEKSETKNKLGGNGKAYFKVIFDQSLPSKFDRRVQQLEKPTAEKSGQSENPTASGRKTRQLRKPGGRKTQQLAVGKTDCQRSESPTTEKTGRSENPTAITLINNTNNKLLIDNWDEPEGDDEIREGEPKIWKPDDEIVKLLHQQFLQDRLVFFPETTQKPASAYSICETLCEFLSEGATPRMVMSIWQERMEDLSKNNKHNRIPNTPALFKFNICNEIKLANERKNNPFTAKELERAPKENPLSSESMGIDEKLVELWEQAKQTIIHNDPSQTAEAMLEPAVLAEINDSKAILAVPSDFLKKQLIDNKTLLNQVCKILNVNDLDIQLNTASVAAIKFFQKKSGG